MRVNLDPEAFSLGDYIDFEEATGETLVETMVKIEQSGGLEGLTVKVIVTLVWVCGRVDNPGLTLEDVRKLKLSDIEIAEPMAKSTVAVRFTSDVRNLKKGIDEVDGGFAKLGTVVKKAAIAGGVALVAFGASSVKAFTEAEEAQAKLTDAFAKFPQLAGENADALRDLNTELARKTKFDDDATASGQAVLAQFGLTADELERITPLMQDFATRTGQDLPSAASSLGKAILGQGRALKQVGIDFTDTGSKAGNLEQIMSGLEEQVGGAAEAMGDTAAGKAAILSNQFGELQEKVGSKLVPALLQLADVGLAVLSFIENMNGPTKKLATGITAMVGAVVAANVAMSLWNKTTSNVSGAMRTAEGSMSRFGKVAAGLGLAGVVVSLAAMAHEASKTTVDVDGLAAALDDLSAQNAANVRETIIGMAAMGELDTAVSKLADTNYEAARQFIDTAEATGVNADEIARLRALLDEKRGTDEAAATAIGASTVATDENTAALDGQTEALWDGIAALDAQLDAMLAQFDTNLAYRRSVDEAADAIANLAATEREHGTSSEEYQDALLDTEASLLGAADAAVTNAVKTAEGFGVTLTAADKSKVYRDELAKQAAALAPGSPLRVRLQGYIDKLNAIPSSKKTVLTLEERRISLTAKKDQQRAHGGPVREGRAYEVGEQGRELFVPSQNGRVVPNGKLGAGSAPASGINLNVSISVPPTMDAGAAGQAITEALAAYVRRNGASDLRLLLGV